MTHTYAVLDVSEAVFNEIKRKLEAAGCDHAFIEDMSSGKMTIDMNGVGLQVEDSIPAVDPGEHAEWQGVFSDGSPIVLTGDPKVDVHLTHCRQGENPDTCKYGDLDCPSFKEETP